ncbi:MAG TPA: hypothetical protein V6D15_23220 [Oculatellaceae cyanobacterium]|jgi:transcriptional regulator with XRE-family HTH domain
MKAQTGKIVQRIYTDEGLRTLAYLILKTRAVKCWSRRQFAGESGVGSDHTIKRLEENIYRAIRPSEPAPYTLHAIATALTSKQELIPGSTDNSEIIGNDLYSLCRGQWEIPAEKQKLTQEEAEFLQRSTPNLPKELCDLQE